MALIAGIDVGNSTTEIVVCNGTQPIAWDRRPTRGTKGSSSSIQAAAALLKAIERRHSISVSAVVVAPWKPVLTTAHTVHEPPPATGNLRLIAGAHHSVAGNGAVAGTPWLVTQPIPAGPLIAIIPRSCTYENAATAINHNSKIVGVLVERDEAVLIAARININLPIIDGVDPQVATAAQRIFMEVRPAGQHVSTATDVWAVSHNLALTESAHADISHIAQWVQNDRTVIIGKFAEVPNRLDEVVSDVITWRTGVTEDVFHAVDKIAHNLVGAIEKYNGNTVDDLWAIDIQNILSSCGVGQTTHTANHSRSIALAELSQSFAPLGIIHDYFDVPVTVSTSEAAAAAIGARTTPGIARDALILDIGGGTIDLIEPAGETSAAGAGELLTSAIAEVLGLPRGAADWIKRGPAFRVESPQVILNEDGSKTFSEKVLPGNLMGMLVTTGPSGYLPLGQGLQLAEWRIVRQVFKREVLAKNIERLLAHRNDSNLVIVGGPATDDELIPAIAQLPHVRAVGRGNVAGTLGQRYSVAYGLTQLAN